MNSRTTTDTGPWRVSTPGRICLFGEHQDYLDLPVISAAISLRLRIDGRFRGDDLVRVSAPDISREYSFRLGEESPGAERPGWRRFLLNGVRVLRERGRTFSRGIDCEIRGEIPIRGGTSSSSAMVVSWVGLLARMSDQAAPIGPEECALLAHRAEVEMSGGAGGRMDQYATAVGGVLFQSFSPDTSLEPLPAPRGRFVLGDSGAPKETQTILASVKARALRLAAAARERDPGFDLRAAPAGGTVAREAGFSAADAAFLRATLRNRDLTLLGRDLLRRGGDALAPLGGLLDEQHELLAGVLGISTPKIDALLEAARAAGAAGGKINGSGGGGCMFAWVDGGEERARIVAGAIERAGGRAWVVSVDGGTRAGEIAGED